MSNIVTKRKGFYISFADTTGPSMPISFRGDGNGLETAIVHDGNYYILNGDHRKGYKKCKTLKACLAYFKAHKADKSSWSD